MHGIGKLGGALYGAYQNASNRQRICMLLPPAEPGAVNGSFNVVNEANCTSETGGRTLLS
jgi:hypothetical protein